MRKLLLITALALISASNVYTQTDVNIGVAISKKSSLADPIHTSAIITYILKQKVNTICIYKLNAK